jgi:hypothetical protein
MSWPRQAPGAIETSRRWREITIATENASVMRMANPIPVI